MGSHWLMPSIPWKGGTNLVATKEGCREVFRLLSDHTAVNLECLRLAFNLQISKLAILVGAVVFR